ncbi:hypothetical protein GCM10010109_40140 [Actinoplanes campanulatus]|nr:hypothetical protein GCM10010109_40140 [Actinoplanes campanulatus]GID39574.1 hypothetical protein Aca09nite_60800 [Actinoplanes campanulatus]
MEENTRREAPRARGPRSPFSTPEQKPSGEEPEAAPSRRGAPPAVTFQPPPSGLSAEGHSSGGGARPVPPQPARTAEPSAAEPTPETPQSAASGPAAARTPAKRAAAKKATPAKKAAPPRKAAPTGEPAPPARRAKKAEKAAPARGVSPVAKDASEQIPPPGDNPAGRNAPSAEAAAPAKKAPAKQTAAKKTAAKRAAAKAVPPVELTVRTPAKRPASRPVQPTLPPREADTAARNAVPTSAGSEPLVTETAPAEGNAAKPTATETAPTQDNAAKPTATETAPTEDDTAEPTAGGASPTLRGAGESTAPEPGASEPTSGKPADLSGPGAVAPATEEPTGDAGEGLGSLTEELLADPARTPEILAHTAVQHIGPRARSWAAQTRASYPTATTEAIARLAVQRFTRSAGIRGGLGALAGPYAPIALVATTVITHAELVLHLAAVYGLDPADPRRADDLLALAAPGKGPIALWAALKLVRLPGVSLLTAVLGARATTEMVAVRARRFYAEYSSQDSQESGSSS